MQIIFVARPKKTNIFLSVRLTFTLQCVFSYSLDSVVCTITEHAYDDLHYNSKLMCTPFVCSLLHTSLVAIIFSCYFPYKIFG